MNAPELFEGDARIIDRGYRSYDGVRTGVGGAMWAVTRHSVQRGIGLRRSIWAKVLPVATIAIAYFPAIVFIGVVALVPSKDLTDFVLPTYGEYYDFVISAIMLFVALVAPEMLCTDRRSGMLGIYLASPLNRDTYLAAKAAAVALVLSLVCLGPPLLMLIANVLQNTGPDGVGNTLLTLGRVLLAGALITLLFTGVTVGIASLTDRKTVASAGIILMFLVTLTVTGILSSTDGANQAVRALSVTTLSLDIARRVRGDPLLVMRGVSWVTVAAAWLLFTVGGFALARQRLRTLPVTR